jgi:large subunit ribosomal protein L1
MGETVGKKHEIARKKIDRLKKYTLNESIELLKQYADKKFNETVDLAINLGVDPKKADQIVRGSVVLPHGLGKKVRVIVFAKGEKATEAEEAGAEVVGTEDLVKKISDGWLDFDKVIATPDLMGMVSKLGKILGPRGLMPNPKTGTVTFDVQQAVKEITAGKADYRTEKTGIVHVSIGKASFDTVKLEENAMTLINALLKAKPSSSKGKYLRKLSISSTMGVGIPVDVASVTLR